MGINFELFDDVRKRNIAFCRNETEKTLEKRVKNQKTVYAFTPIPQTVGLISKPKKIGQNRRTAHRKVPKPQNLKQVDPPSQ